MDASGIFRVNSGVLISTPPRFRSAPEVSEPEGTVLRVHEAAISKISRRVMAGMEPDGEAETVIMLMVAQNCPMPNTAATEI